MKTNFSDYGTPLSREEAKKIIAGVAVPGYCEVDADCNEGRLCCAITNYCMHIVDMHLCGEGHPPICHGTATNWACVKDADCPGTAYCCEGRCYND